MGKLKKFTGVITEKSYYLISASSEEEAKELLSKGTPFAATDNQKGVATLYGNGKLLIDKTYAVFNVTPTKENLSQEKEN